MTDPRPPEPAATFALHITTEGVVTTNESDTENKENGQ